MDEIISRKVLVILQARLSSKRLPRKMLLDFGGVPLYFYIYKRLEQLSFVDEVVIATSTDGSDTDLVNDALDRKCRVIRGDLENVYSRFVKCIEELKPQLCIRICGDSPFFDEHALELLVEKAFTNEITYGILDSNCCVKGFESEVVRPEILLSIKDRVNKQEQEHVTLFIRKNLNLFKSLVLQKDYKYSINVCDLTIDTFEDYINAVEILTLIKDPSHIDANEVLYVAGRLKDNDEIII